MHLRCSLLRPLAFAVLLYGANADPQPQPQLGSSAPTYPPTLAPIVNRANALLSAGQFNDAAKAYTEAIEQAPTDYLLYYKRATAYYSLSRHPAALEDFDQVLALTGDTFDRANLMKARVHAQLGRFGEAREFLRKYTTKVKGDTGANEVMMGITEGELAAKKISQAIRAKLWQACVEAASTALATASYAPKFRQQRADCSLAAGDIEGAVADFSRLAQLTTPSTTLFMKTARIGYFLFPYTSPTDPQSPAMNTLKQCLHYDPDSKPCKGMHRLVKAFDKSFKQLDAALAKEDWRGVVRLLLGADEANSEDAFAAKFDQALLEHTSRESLNLPPQIQIQNPLKTAPRRQAILRALCRSYVKMNQAKKGEQWCTALLEMEGMQDDADGLMGRAESLFLREEWEEAVRVLERAFEASGRSSREIHQKLQKAQKLLKQSKQKDYYKVLDIARDADAKTIKKAFRRAVLKAHPDKGGSEAKMAAVNEAYEVLSKPELRERYDNGDDPNDPTGGQAGNPFAGHGGQPFAHFFQQGGFSGGFPGGFQFHYAGH